MPTSKKTNASSTSLSQTTSNAPTRIDTIVLFGSQKLTRESGTGAWVFATGATKSKRLTTRESMFINAALHAAGGQ